MHIDPTVFAEEVHTVMWRQRSPKMCEQLHAEAEAMAAEIV